MNNRDITAIGDKTRKFLIISCIRVYGMDTYVVHPIWAKNPPKAHFYILRPAETTG